MEKTEWGSASFCCHQAGKCGRSGSCQEGAPCRRFDWDTYDTRHSVQGRDDIANLERMYYHLFRNVLRSRWPDGSTWLLCPDENSAVNWIAVRDCLRSVSYKIQDQQAVLPQTGISFDDIRLEFGVEEIIPSKSCDEPIIQLADLFVGLAVYSRTNYQAYENSLDATGGQQSLQLSGVPTCGRLSGPDIQRCQVLQALNSRCKASRLGVSLERSRGLRTYDPSKPINFWWYRPQTMADKAPVR